MRDTQTIIPFGIHKNKQLSDSTIPNDYIKWLGMSRGYCDPTFIAD